MWKNVWIIGAGSFALDIAFQFMRTPGSGNRFMGLVDDRKIVRDKAEKILEKEMMNIQVKDTLDLDFENENNRFMFGVSDGNFKLNFHLEKKIKRFQYHNYDIDTRISQNSIVEAGIYFGCKISALTKVGVGNFFDHYSVVGHDCVIGDFNHFGIGAIIGGNSNIGNGNIIHSGAIIGKGINIGNNCIIGAGCTVLRDLQNGSKLISPKAIKIN